MGRSFFHLHLVSDSTGETLITVGRAATAQYQGISPIEHVYPLVRNMRQLDRVISEIENEPGIVLFTLVEKDLSERLRSACEEMGCPSMSVLEPIVGLFQSYLGVAMTPRIGGQHTLSTEYFRRIDALNFTMMHDDGQLLDNLEQADVVLVGVSRTSKTPTSIYLANRGIKTANVPLVPGVAPPPELEHLLKPLVVGLVASPERIVQIRQNRLLALNADGRDATYTDKQSVIDEILRARRLFDKHDWPVIDVTRRSIEETAAAIIDLHRTHRLRLIAQ
ncbi:MAG: kinase/pyrophosphorylase [Methylobacterium sp.]|jgi:regulator of PEP synthase PpsR (kinase-PPPase family)|nr:kinase/pyrophosphorylase [Methylobacterium sp.]MCA3598838.1 kinase/pyrophosphorylase [Methylobacterium sp.]MCA3600880.1 kinase/pyrophosphorylase [Methylobacterium sp.]MCA3602756.1 kinase/pyrophosphorylase [Methylobacterium sp.]MCA3605417.1 kinase/pyrophosphorylase [Methylobacterium sp.]